MVTKQDDAKIIIKELLTNLGNIKSKTIYRDNLEIRITRTDDGSIRFDLPDQGKAFVLMSGRLYERQFNQKIEEPEKPEDEPGKKKSLSCTEIEERPTLAEQLSYRGEVEMVDTRIFKNRITCECGKERWVKNSDLFQTKCCKPCAHRKRRDRRKIKKVAA